MISLAHLDVGTRVTPSSTGEPPCTRGRPTGNGHHGMPPTSTMIGRAAICTTIAVAAMMTLTACAAVVTVVPGSTRRICELTGEDSINRTETRFKLRGTDLGASFQGDELTNVIYFLFGDTVPVGAFSDARPDGGDSIAFTTPADPESCIHLDFFRAPDRGYISPRVNDVSLGRFEVPSGGFFAQELTYLLFTTLAFGDPFAPHAAVLAHGGTFINNTLTFQRLYELPRDKFINVSPVTVDQEWHPSRQPTSVLLFGTGEYRRSRDVFLALLPVPGVENPANLRYFAGVDSVGLPRWVPDPAQARSVFARSGPPCMGELSVTFNRFIGNWLMLYQCDPPRGINFRVADQPWGPWSAPRLLFDPWKDGGYCTFMHAVEDGSVRCPSGSPNPKDDLVIGGPARWGGEYGPYVIDTYSRGDEKNRTTTIYFVMSTWNPYQVVLMKSTLRARCPITGCTAPRR